MATVDARLAAQPVCPGTVNPSVLTGQYDNARDAYNGNETCLYSTGSALSVSLTGGSFSPLLVGDPPPHSGFTGYNPIYAQPLYVPNITVQHPLQGTCTPSCNMVVVVTAYGSIYAFNADNGYTLWSRTGTGVAQGTNWLWADDCGPTGNVVGSAPHVGPPYIGPGLPFAGIVSTPVIDTQPPNTSPQYTATMFVTSVCQTPPPTNQPQWWLHEIDLAGLAAGDVAGQDISKVQINSTSGSITFNASNQLQRPALLEIKVPNATPNPLIYVAFGVAGSETTPANPYHGWLLGYTIDSSAALVATSLAFVATPTSCGSGGGTTQCPTGNGGTPPCDCLVNTTVNPPYQNAPNWGGFGGGIWMSGRGPASMTDSNSLAHTFVATGNGGFQTGQSGSAYNRGDSILDFHLSSAGMPTAPSDYFTPYGGPPDCWTTNSCLPAVQPLLQNSSCAYDNPGGSDTTCNHTVELFNEYDWDMGVAGIALFNDSSGRSFAVTVDKAGYGYLLLQDNMRGFTAGAPRKRFPAC